MKQIHFKVILKSNIIINERSATEGLHTTLSFIPGNNFLGMAASKLYTTLDPEDAFLLFHSGKVRFSDAMPLHQHCIPVMVKPRVWMVEKGKKAEDGMRLFSSDLFKNNSTIQYKPAKGGYFVLEADQTTLVEYFLKKGQTIKTAYNSEKRKSDDAKLFTYQHMEKGSEWMVSVTADDDVSDTLIEKISNSLEGGQRVGRSSSAEFGLIEMKPIQELKKTVGGRWQKGLNYVYAASRLIFTNPAGEPVLEPQVLDFGLSAGKLDYTQSQVGFFRYSPYNGKRKVYDTERVGFEKGTVFCINLDEPVDADPLQFIGSYQHEGFGEVLVNPSFILQTELLKIKQSKKDEQNEKESKPAIQNSPLLKYVRDAKAHSDAEMEIDTLIAGFIKDHSSSLKSIGNSQWGSIRAMALAELSKHNAGFKQLHNTICEYINHGIKADAWSKGNRKGHFDKFLKTLSALPAIPESLKVEAVVKVSTQIPKLK